MLAKLTNFLLIFKDQIGSNTCSALIVLIDTRQSGHYAMPKPTTKNRKISFPDINKLRNSSNFSSAWKPASAETDEK